MTELHEALLQVKKDYDLLRMEFEQNLKSNEQTGIGAQAWEQTHAPAP